MLNDSPLFLFYLVNAAGQSYYLDNNGSVRTSGRPVPLNYSPDGWQDLSLGFERNLQKFGLVRSFTVSLGFFGDGSQILKYLYFTRTVDEAVWLVVQKREVEVTDTDFYIWYPIYYKGEIDLSTFKSAAGKVTASVMEGGRSKELAANTATEYLLPVDLDADAVRVRFPGLQLQQTASFLFPSDVVISNTDYFRFTMPMGLIAEDTQTGGTQDPAHAVSGGTSTGTGFFSQSLEDLTPDVLNYVKTSANYSIFNAQAITPRNPTPGPITYHIKGQLNFAVTKNDVNGTFFISLIGKSILSPTDLNGIQLKIPGPFPVGGVFSIPIDETITLNPGDNLFIAGELFAPVTGAVEIAIKILENSNFTVTFSNAYPPSFVKMLPAFSLYQRFITRMCGKKDYATSSLLKASTVCVTCGDALRGLVGASIKSTFDQYFNTFSRLYCAGVGVEGLAVVFEGRDYFLNDANVYDLGEIKSLEAAPYTAAMFNTVDAGYADQSYDNLNGRYEFNALNTFIMPRALRVAKKLDLKLDYRGDYFGAEFCRINLQGKLTVDAASDNDTWIFDIDLANPQQDAQGTYYELRHLAYTSVEGLPDTSVANIELSPKRILLAWRDWVRSVFYGYAGGELRFETATKNKNLVTTLNGVTVAEYDGLATDTAGRLLFKPTQLTVKGVAANRLATLLQSQPATCFSFTYKGLAFKGFLLKCAIKPKTKEEQQFVFLSHPDNNLNLLINAE